MDSHKKNMYSTTLRFLFLNCFSLFFVMYYALMLGNDLHVLFFVRCFAICVMFDESVRDRSISYRCSNGVVLKWIKVA